MWKGIISAFTKMFSHFLLFPHVFLPPVRMRLLKLSMEMDSPAWQQLHLLPDVRTHLLNFFPSSAFPSPPLLPLFLFISSSLSLPDVALLAKEVLDLSLSKGSRFCTDGLRYTCQSNQLCFAGVCRLSFQR